MNARVSQNMFFADNNANANDSHSVVESFVLRDDNKWKGNILFFPGGADSFELFFFRLFLWFAECLGQMGVAQHVVQPRLLACIVDALGTKVFRFFFSPDSALPPWRCVSFRLCI